MQKNDDEIKKARLRAMKLLESRDYTEEGLRRKLTMFPQEVTDDAVEYVKSYGYINDLRYAKNYLRSCTGVRSLRDTVRRLKEKGVSEEIIDEALSEEDFDEEAESALIKRLILKRCSDLSELDHSGQQKLFAYMYNKGFDIDRVRRILEELLLDITS